MLLEAPHAPQHCRAPPHLLQGTYLWNALHHTAVTDERWATATGPLDPSLFNPERMLGEEGQKPGAQLPFGYGPRCVASMARVPTISCALYCAFVRACVCVH